MFAGLRCEPLNIVPVMGPGKEEDINDMLVGECGSDYPAKPDSWTVRSSLEVYSYQTPFVGCDDGRLCPKIKSDHARIEPLGFDVVLIVI